MTLCQTCMYALFVAVINFVLVFVVGARDSELIINIRFFLRNFFLVLFCLHAV